MLVMRHLSEYLFCAVFLLALASCGRDNRASGIMDRAEACLEIAPDSAFVALDSLDRALLRTPELKARHALLYSIALENIGMHFCDDSIINIAVSYYQKIPEKGDDDELDRALHYRELVYEHAADYARIDTLTRQKQLIISERYADKMELADKEHTDRIRSTVTVAVSVAFLVAVAGIVLVRKRLAGIPNKEAMEIISKRLDILDSILASRIGENPSYERLAEKNLDELISDREKFLESTRSVFEATHPEFIRTLADSGLSEWEISYCCLYLLGLKGKEVGEFIQKKRHYIIDHEIRQKLGLTEHDTNLAPYLRGLIAKA